MATERNFGNMLNEVVGKPAKKIAKEQKGKSPWTKMKTKQGEC